MNPNKSTKKTAVVYCLTTLELGGAQKVCLALADAHSDDYTTVLIAGAHGPLQEQANKGTYQKYLLPLMQRDVGVHALWREVKLFVSLVRLLKKIKKEYAHVIIHTHSTKAGLVGRWAAWYAGIKYRVHTIHGYGFNQEQSWPVWSIIYFLELVTSFITTQYITVSQTDSDRGKKLFPFFSRKTTLIRAAVNTQFFDCSPFRLRLPGLSSSASYDGHVDTGSGRTERTDHPECSSEFERRRMYRRIERVAQVRDNQFFIIGTIACFKPQKNIFDLLQAFQFVHKHNPTARLEIIGDGVLRKSIEAWIHENNLAHVITLHGWQHDVYSYLTRWHAFSLTSLWEGLPCAIIEARLMKLPVVSYRTGGIPEVIRDHYNGLLYNQKDWQNLAHGLLTLSQNQDLYHKLSLAPDDLTTFDLDYMRAAHARLYRQLLH